MIDKDEESLGLLIHDVAHHLRVLIDRRVARFQLTRLKWQTLAILDRKDGITQTDLANRLDLEKSTVGRLLNRMELRGFIHRERDKNDRRITRIFIENKIRPLLEELEYVSDEVKNIATNGLDKREQNEFMRLLIKMKSNLQVD